MNPNMTNRQKVLPELSQIDLSSGPFNLISPVCPQAQPKHLSCIAVSSFHLACSQVLDQETPDTRSPPLLIPEPSDLVTISQSRCSASDLLRMEAILANKLDNKQQQVWIKHSKSGDLIRHF